MYEQALEQAERGEATSDAASFDADETTEEWTDEGFAEQFDVGSYWLTFDHTVADVLGYVPGAEEIFERHGCLPTLECTDEHHTEYTLGELDLVCHIDDCEALLDELNAALAAAEAAHPEAVSS